jgi:hypothetical protein
MRAASVAVAFILAENRSMFYEEALNHVRSRRPAFPHSGLKDAIYRLFPRTGVEAVCQTVSTDNDLSPKCVYCSHKTCFSQFIFSWL